MTFGRTSTWRGPISACGPLSATTVRDFLEHIAIAEERQLVLLLGVFRQRVDVGAFDVVWAERDPDRGRLGALQQRLAGQTVERAGDLEPTRFLEAADRLGQRRTLLAVDHAGRETGRVEQHLRVKNLTDNRRSLGTGRGEWLSGFFSRWLVADCHCGGRGNGLGAGLRKRDCGARRAQTAEGDTCCFGKHANSPDANWLLRLNDAGPD